jgi:arginine utilization protein RocB
VFTIGPRPVKRASRQRWRRRHGGGDTYYLKPSKDEWYIGYCVGKARSSILRKISKWRTYKYESSETVSRTIQSLITDGKVDSYELRYEIAKIAKEVQDEMQAERFDTLSRTLNLDTRWASIRMHERLANLRGADRRK